MPQRVRVGLGSNETAIEIPDTDTNDFPRDSWGRIVVNYAPSALVVLGFVVYPCVASYLWIDAVFSRVGYWAYLPILFVAVIAATAALVLRTLLVSHDPTSSNDLVIRVSPRQSIATAVCRVACVLWHLFLVLSLALSIILLSAVAADGDFPILALVFAVTCGLCYFIYSSYQWYTRCWFENAIIAQNERLYGPTIFVSIPVFKLCGHFTLVISDHKYELRLDTNTHNRPVFRERLLLPHEGEGIRNAFGHHWFIVGWTRRRDDQIRAAFTDVIECFGQYHRLRNNCRHFLQSGTMRILDFTSTWHEDMLLVGASLDVTIPKMTLMMWRSIQRDLYRWYWARRYGQDWETRASNEFNHRAMIVDLRDHEFDPSGYSVEAETIEFSLHEHVLQFCCPWIFTIFAIVVLATLVLWASGRDDSNQVNMPLGLRLGVYAVSTVVSVTLVIYGCCRV